LWSRVGRVYKLIVGREGKDNARNKDCPLMGLGRINGTVGITTLDESDIGNCGRLPSLAQ
jgi:hypothetical protein